MLQFAELLEELLDVIIRHFVIQVGDFPAPQIIDGLWSSQH